MTTTSINSAIIPDSPSQVSTGRVLLRYLRPERRRFALLMALLLTSIALQLVNPQIIRWFLDGAEQQRPLRTLLGAASIFIAATILRQAILLLATYVGENVGWRATNALRADLARHALGLDLTFHKTHRPGELIERVDGDVNELAKFFSRLVISLLGNLLLLVGVLVFLWLEDWRVGLAITAITLVGATIVENLRRRMTPRWERLRAASADLMALIEERLNGLEDVRANGGEAYVMQRLYKRLHARIHAMHHAIRLNVFLITFPIWTFGVIYAAAHWLGGARFLDGTLTIGGVYLIFHYVGLLEGPLWEVLHQVEEFQKVAASTNRIAWLFGVQPSVEPPSPVASSLVGEDLQTQAGRKPEERKIEEGPLALTFEHVSFRYEDDPEPVLRDLSFALEAGTVLGLLGRTGSGKSTLTKLLFRFYDPTAGAVCIRSNHGDSECDDWLDLRDVPQSALRRRIAMVTQEVQIFNASLRHNLTLFDDRVPDERLVDALEEVGLGGWFAGLADGLSTKLSSGGLSAGEAQLLALTRIFLSDPGLIVLDEASSRLDPATEALIEQALDKLLRGRTVIIIAHRLATVQRADEIMILDEGRIIEHGDRIALAADGESRFAGLLRTGLEEVKG